MSLDGIRPGIVIKNDLKWPEPVEVKNVSKIGGFVRIVGVTTVSGQHIDQLIPLSEVANIQISTVVADFGSERKR